MKYFTILLLGLTLCSAAHAEPVRVYMIGNSLTDEVKYDDWIRLCKAGGVEALYARKMIPGAPLEWHRTHPADGFLTRPYGPPEQAFEADPWDALTLQPFRQGEEEPALYYADLLWKHHPDARVYVYAQWPNRSSDDWVAGWERVRDTIYLPTCKALRAHKTHGDQVFMIPAGWAMHRLHKKMELGLVPGFHSAWDLYSDGVHVSNVGSYLVGLSFYATIFGKSPEGLPVGGYQGVRGSPADYFTITPQLAKIIQETVWEAVTALPESGVQSDRPVAVTQPALTAAVHQEPYAYAIDAAFGTPPYRWSVSRGRLPEGFALSDTGELQGTPQQCVDSTFTVRVTDSKGESAEKPFALNVVEDTAPVIATKELPALQQGGFVDLKLTATSGNPPHSWQVAGGTLPPGLILLKSGRLYGSPAIDGAYSVQVQVTDADGAHPESDAVTFSGTIAAADRKRVFFARKAAGKIRHDGTLDPAEGWKLETPLKKELLGKSSNTVFFDAQWDGDYLYVAVSVQDDAVLTRSPFFENDCVVFYVDGTNNREDTYNIDDRRLVFGPADKNNLDRSNSIGSSFNTVAACSRTADGYLIEARFKLDAIGVPDQIEGGKFDAAHAVIGFDIVNRDRDIADGDQTRLGWQGTIDNPENPGGFGTLILMP